MKNIEILVKYTDEKFANYVANLITGENILIKIKNSRNTKLGDYIEPHGTIKNHSITVNNNLGKDKFCVVLLHEIAHFNTFKKYGRKKNILPHGKEWQNEFTVLLNHALENKIFDDDLQEEIKLFVKNKFSRMANANLHQKIDEKLGIVKKRVEHLEIGEVFELKNGKKFKKLEKIRKFYLCEEINTKTKYKVHGIAEVV